MLAGMVSEAMDKSDCGEYREAIKMGSSCCMFSIMLGEAPTALFSFTIISAGHLGLRDFPLALEFAERAVSILQPTFDMGILHSMPGVDKSNAGTAMNGMRHAQSSYDPKTILVCESFARIATGMVHSRAMRMPEAIVEYKKAEAALRMIKGRVARSMLVTTLNNIGNNLQKNSQPDAAAKVYAEARALAMTTGKEGAKNSMREVRVSQVLAMHGAGKTEEAVSELLDIWRVTTWKADEMAEKRQVLLLLTNLSPTDQQPKWFRLFDELLQSLGNDAADACPICLGKLLPDGGGTSEPFQRVQVTTCFHTLHEACWVGYKAAQGRKEVHCPVCRHPIIVHTYVESEGGRLHVGGHVVG